MIDCASKTCTRHVEYSEGTCLTQDFTKCSICGNHNSCPWVVLTADSADCVAWRCIAHADPYMISTATLSSKLRKISIVKHF